MFDVETGLIIELPLEMSSDVFLTPVRGGLNPLEILCGRMEKVVPRKDMVFLSGHDEKHIPYGSYLAGKKLSLFRTDVQSASERMMKASSMRRAKTMIRINACHTFADPELIQGMVDMHCQLKAAYTRLEGPPEWLGGEIYSGKELIDAHLIAVGEDRKDEQPGDILSSKKEKFIIGTYKPSVRGSWKNLNLSLAGRQSAAALFEVIRRAPDPMTVTYRDFLE